MRSIESPNSEVNNSPVNNYSPPGELDGFNQGISRNFSDISNASSNSNGGFDVISYTSSEPSNPGGLSQGISRDVSNVSNGSNGSNDSNGGFDVISAAGSDNFESFSDFNSGMSVDARLDLDIPSSSKIDSGYESDGDSKSN